AATPLPAALGQGDRRGLRRRRGGQLRDQRRQAAGARGAACAGAVPLPRAERRRAPARRAR
ncbi:unnamed protein product, partial [Prorocentrum cordatum]